MRMRSHPIPVRFGLWIIVLVLLSICPVLAAEGQARLVVLDHWLVLGPVDTPLPAFAAEKTGGWSVGDLLVFDSLPLDRLRPSAGTQAAWPDGTIHLWTALDRPEWQGPADQAPRTVYLATYLDAHRWVAPHLEVTSPQPVAVFVDGVRVVDRRTADKDPDPVVKTDLKLETGKHLLVIKSVLDPDSGLPWRLATSLELPAGEGDAMAVTASASPMHRLSLDDLMNPPAISDVRLSADGRFAAVSYTRLITGTDDSESWIEIMELPDGQSRQVIRVGESVRNFLWAPSGHRYAYLASIAEGTTNLFVGDLDAGTVVSLLDRQKDFDGFSWGTDGRWILFSRTRKPEHVSKDVKHMLELPDRWTYWRNRSFLYGVSVPGGVVTRLTAGELSTDGQDVSPDGHSVVFTREVVDYSQRPYSRTQLYVMDLKTLKADLLWEGRWFNGCRWDPDGSRLLVLGGPSAFGDIGVNVPEGRLPNDYDIQAYMFDIKTRQATALSREFNPSIQSAVWQRNGDTVYLTAEDGSYVHLFHLQPDTDTIKPVSVDVDVVRGFRVAADAPRAVYYGTSVTGPQRLYLLDLKSGQSRLLREPAGRDFADVQLGECRDWSFVNREGTTIQGRVYLPPGFDPNHKYPCIVYYYGGTSPVTRDFGGRYPKNWWAANGYVVYVLQPSGATGYGQVFSAYHVNDWGKVVADEIIDGVKKFLAAHPFVDPKRVGCIGASFGGFMTQLLVTRTDIFAAAISHAGISSISSYWGEGWWGYSYNAVSAANSFPWNRPDIYIDQSPLFHADKINTPLLLLHGTADTNVPPGESMQMFTALKLLGKNVEFVQILGANHWVVRPSRKLVWYRTIVAWFDRYLKQEPAFWNNLYPNP